MHTTRVGERELLLVDGAKYVEHHPKDEKELEEFVKEHFGDIFGENSLYFAIKPELRSKAGMGSKPDGFVIVFDKPCFYVVEIERAEHDVHDHVVSQISKFNTALKRPETERKIADAIYDEITRDSSKESFVRSRVKTDSYKFLTDLVSEKPIIVIIIDEIVDELKDAVAELPLKSRIVEFKTYEKVGAGFVGHAHSYGPLEEPEVKRPKKLGKEYPHYTVNWEARLKWVTPEIRDRTGKLIKRLEFEFPGMAQVPRHRYLYFYKGEDRSLQSLFAVLMIGKKYVAVRIKTDPAKFRDEGKWTKKYKGWFYPRKKCEEREFFIPLDPNKADFDYAIKLIKHSYGISRG